MLNLTGINTQEDNSNISTNNPLKPLEYLDMEAVNQPELLDLISKFMDYSERSPQQRVAASFDTSYIHDVLIRHKLPSNLQDIYKHYKNRDKKVLKTK